MKKEGLLSAVRVFIALTFIFSLALVPTTPVAAQPPPPAVDIVIDTDNVTPGIQTDNITAGAGDTFSVDVWVITHGLECVSAAVYLIYNPAYVQVTGITNDTSVMYLALAPSIDNNYNHPDGYVVGFAGASGGIFGPPLEPFVTTDFTLARFDFQVQSLGTSGTNIAILLGPPMETGIPRETKVKRDASTTHPIGKAKPRMLTVYTQPVIDFIGDPLTMPAGGSVTFTASLTGGGPVDNWSWDFNNDSEINTVTTDNITSWDFDNQIGPYSVNLTAANPYFSTSVVKEDYITVTHGPLHHLTVTGSDTMNAGDNNTLTITAKDEFGNTVTAYTDNKSLTFSGPVASLHEDDPTVTDNTDAAIPVGTPTTVIFTDGVSTSGGSLVAYKAESPTVHVTDGVVSSSPSYGLALTVYPLAADSLRVTGDPEMNAGDNNELTVTARDEYGNVDTSYADAKSLTFSGPNVSDYGDIPKVEGTAIGAAKDFSFTAGQTEANAVTLVAYKIEVIEVDVFAATINSTADTDYDLDLTVFPDTASHLKVTGDPTMNAGDSNMLTITAYDPYGNPDSGYEGIKSLTFSGPGVSFDEYPPTVAGTDIGTPTDINFTGGMAIMADLVAYLAEVTHVDVTDTEIATDNADCGQDLTVYSLAEDSLRVTGDTSMNAGDSNELTVSARDEYGNVATGYTGSKSLTFSGPGISDYDYTPTVEETPVETEDDFDFTAGQTTAEAVTLIAYKVETIEVEVFAATINSTADAAHDLNLTVNPDTASHLKVTGDPEMNAGGENELTVSAFDPFGNPDTGYEGLQSLTFSGPGVSPGSDIPTVEGTPIGDAADFSFTAGQTAASDVTLVAYKAEPIEVDVFAATINSTANATWNLDLLVDPDVLSKVTVTPASVEIIVTENYTFTAAGQDLYSNNIPGYTFTWDVVAGGGNITSLTDTTALFIAEEVLGTFTNTIKATCFQDTNYYGFATVNVTGVTIEVIIRLQGDERGVPELTVPFIVKLFDAGESLTWMTIVNKVLLETSDNFTTSDWVNGAGGITIPVDGIVEASPGVPGIVTLVIEDVLPGPSYQLAITSPHNLINLRKDVEITTAGAVGGPVDMELLLEGNADDSYMIDIDDFTIFAGAFRATPADTDRWNPNADFDRSDKVTILDFGLLATNFNETSPIPVP